MPPARAGKLPASGTHALHQTNSRSGGAADFGMRSRKYESKSVRVISPRTLSSSITIATPRRSMDETLLGHPEIIVHFREIFVAGIRNQANHAFRVRLLPAITQRASDKRSGG